MDMLGQLHTPTTLPWLKATLEPTECLGFRIGLNPLEKGKSHLFIICIESYL